MAVSFQAFFLWPRKKDIEKLSKAQLNMRNVARRDKNGYLVFTAGYDVEIARFFFLFDVIISSGDKGKGLNGI